MYTQWPLLGYNEQRVSLEDPPCKYRRSPIPLSHYNLIVTHVLSSNVVPLECLRFLENIYGR